MASSVTLLLALSCYKSGFYDFWHENTKIESDCISSRLRATEYKWVADKAEAVGVLHDEDQVLLGWVEFEGPEESSSWMRSKATGVARRYGADLALLFERKFLEMSEQEVEGEEEVARVRSISSDGYASFSTITVPTTYVRTVRRYEYRMWFTRARDPDGSCDRHSPPKARAEPQD